MVQIRLDLFFEVDACILPRLSPTGYRWLRGV